MTFPKVTWVYYIMNLTFFINFLSLIGFMDSVTL